MENTFEMSRMSPFTVDGAGRPLLGQSPDVEAGKSNVFNFESDVMQDTLAITPEQCTSPTSTASTGDVAREDDDVEEKTIWQIAQDGDEETMKVVLGTLDHPLGDKLNKQDADKFTPLHYAARYNHVEMCKLLVEKGADVNALGEDKVTPLHLAAKYKPKQDDDEELHDKDKENKNVVEFLIERGSKLGAKDFYGMTPLHHASLLGNVECVKLILKKDKKLLNVKDKQKMTPLHIAAVYGQADVAGILVEEGADLKCETDDGGTPLLFSAAEGKLKVVELILEKYLKSGDICEMLKHEDINKNTSLYLAVGKGHFEVAKYLIDICINNNYREAINAHKQTNRRTALHVASRHGHLKIVELLVKKGARIGPRDESLSTPLILASKYGRHEVVKFLLNEVADRKKYIEKRNSDHLTALLIAAKYGHTETIDHLLKKGADVMAVDKNQRNVLFQCAEEGRVEAIQNLLNYGKDPSKLLALRDRYGNTPLHVAAQMGHYKVVKILLGKASQINPKNEDEQTPLHLAAENGRVKIVQELVRKKHEIIHSFDENANSPLHLAALSGKISVVRELVQLGASIGARNAKQWTPLHCCASTGMHKSAQVLLEADFPVDPKDKMNQTPLHLACMCGSKSLVQLLLKWKADITKKDKDGRNALDFAIDFGHASCARVILEDEKWKEAMKNGTKEKDSELIDTPMRKLIRKMPDVAEEVFTKCMRGNKNGAKNENGGEEGKDNKEITYYYELLEDEFSCKDWCQKDAEAETESCSPTQLQVVSESSCHAVETDCRHKDEGTSSTKVEEKKKKLGSIPSKPYTEDSNLLKTNHPIYIMICSKHEKLLLHPLVCSFLDLKWSTYATFMYMLDLLMYVLILAIFNSYMLTTPPIYSIDAVNVTPSCVAIISQAQPNYGECYDYNAWGSIARIIILMLAGISLMKEGYQLYNRKFSYFLSLTNILELSFYIMAILTVYSDYPTSAGPNFRGIREVWQWQVGAVSIFLSWMGLIMFIQNLPVVGMFVLMFKDVYNTFMKFFVVFVLFILGFAFSFHCLLQNKYASQKLLNSVIKTFIMMIGEFDLDALSNEEITLSIMSYSAVAYLLFIFFLVIMSIIIMNLLTGLAVYDITEMRENAELKRFTKQAQLILDVDSLLPPFIKRKFFKTSYTYNIQNNKSIFRPCFYSDLENDKNSKKIDKTRSMEKSFELQNKFVEVDRKFDDLQHRVRLLRRQFDVRSRSMECMIKAIMEKLKVTYDEKDEDFDSNL